MPPKFKKLNWPPSGAKLAKILVQRMENIVIRNSDKTGPNIITSSEDISYFRKRVLKEKIKREKIDKDKLISRYNPFDEEEKKQLEIQRQLDSVPPLRFKCSKTIRERKNNGFYTYVNG